MERHYFNNDNQYISIHTFLRIPEVSLDGPGNVLPEVLKESQDAVTVDHADLGVVDVGEEIDEDVAPCLEHRRVPVRHGTLGEMAHYRVVEVWRQTDDVFLQEL